jgi:ferritin-like protein
MLLLAGSALGGLASPAAAATGPSDADLAYARLLVAVELLALDFYGKAIGSRRFEVGVLRELRVARADERRHYDASAAILTSANQVPATAADIDFSYPKGAFASRASIVRLGIRLESLSLGAYLGAVEGYEAGPYRRRAAQAAANESQHLSVLSAAVGGRRIGAAFPEALSIDRVSDTLDRYTS